VITEQDYEEWFESPVTQHFVKLLEARLEAVYQMRSDVFCPGEPNRTQEVKSHLLGAEAELGQLLDAFTEKDLEQLEEKEVAEQVRNSPVRRPGAH
jgi:hypothetical protein